MLWLFLIVAWFLQLHFVEPAAWFGVAWPLFVIITIFISPKMNKYKLSWVLLFLGVIADLSSHLQPGIVLKSYLVLIVLAWLLPLISKYLNKIKFGRFIALILMVDLVYLVGSTSVNALLFNLSHEVIIISIMAAIILSCIHLAKNIFENDYEKT